MAARGSIRFAGKSGAVARAILAAGLRGDTAERLRLVDLASRGGYSAALPFVRAEQSALASVRGLVSREIGGSGATIADHYRKALRRARGGVGRIDYLPGLGRTRYVATDERTLAGALGYAVGRYVARDRPKMSGFQSGLLLAGPVATLLTGPLTLATVAKLALEAVDTARSLRAASR